MSLCPPPLCKSHQASGAKQANRKDWPCFICGGRSAGLGGLSLLMHYSTAHQRRNACTHAHKPSLHPWAAPKGEGISHPHLHRLLDTGSEGAHGRQTPDPSSDHHRDGHVPLCTEPPAADVSLRAGSSQCRHVRGLHTAGLTPPIPGRAPGLLHGIPTENAGAGVSPIHNDIPALPTEPQPPSCSW